jgi:hypothetical protein
VSFGRLVGGLGSRDWTTKARSVPFAEQPREFARAVDMFIRGGWPESAVKALPAPATHTRSGFADVAGGRLYYESVGSGDAVVLIHAKGPGSLRPAE